MYFIYKCNLNETCLLDLHVIVSEVIIFTLKLTLYYNKQILRDFRYDIFE